jgi:nucleoside-diphosphate-sugar epimerase
VLVTGATGFLGKEVLPLLRALGHRRTGEAGAERESRVVGLSRKPPEHSGRQLSGVGPEQWVQADLTQWNGGLGSEALDALTAERFDFLLHLAALYDLRANEDESYLQNVTATHTALTLAARLGIPRFAFASSVAVTLGDPELRKLEASGERYAPDRLRPEGEFPDHYGRDKARAEELVRSWAHPFEERLILRLGVLCGNTRGDAPARIDGPYWAMEAFERLAPLLKSFPGRIPVVGRPAKSRLPLVPVDAAARAVVDLLLHHFENPAANAGAQSPGAPSTTAYFLTPPGGGVGPEAFYGWLLEQVGAGKRELLYLDRLPDWFQKLAMQWASGIPSEELAYFLGLPACDDSATRRILGPGWCPEFDDFKQNLWKGFRSFRTR